MQVDFETKKKMLFECLESAEKNLQGTTLEQTNRNNNLSQNNKQRKRTRDDYVEKYKHKDSMFKRPDMPINKCLRYRQRPDYEVEETKFSWNLITFEIYRKIQESTLITLLMMSLTLLIEWIPQQHLVFSKSLKIEIAMSQKWIMKKNLDVTHRKLCLKSQ